MEAAENVKKIELLKKVPLFAHLKDKDLQSVSSLLKENTFKKGDCFINQGEVGIGLFIIKTGKIKIVKKLSSGKELDIAVHGPEEFIGELSVLDNKPRTASAVALEETTTYVMTYWDFNALLNDRPQLALDIIPVLVERFRETNEQLLELKNC